MTVTSYVSHRVVPQHSRPIDWGYYYTRKACRDAAISSYRSQALITGMVVSAVNTSFVYDADGGRVKATFGSTSTICVGSHYERTGNALIK